MTQAHDPFWPDQSLAEALRRHRVEAGLFRYDPHADRLEGDAAWARMWGLGDRPFRGGIEAWLSRVAEADRALLRAELRLVNEGLGDELRGELRVDSPAGERWLAVRARIAVEAGRSQLCGHARDVSETRRRELALGAAESRLHDLLALCPDAVALFRDGRYLLASPRMVSLLGLSRADELHGQSLFRFVPEDEAERLGEELRELALAEPGAARWRRQRLVRADGVEIAAEIGFLRGSFGGQPVVIESVREAVARPAALDALAATVAHEVNNPLNVVQLALDSLLADLPALFARARAGGEGAGAFAVAREEDFVERLRDAREGTRRIQAIVRELGRAARRAGAGASAAGAEPSPAAPPVDRRRAPRAPGRALAGVLQEPERGTKVAVALVDYSPVGLRIARADKLRADLSPVHVDLVRSDTAELVEADLDLVREVNTGAGRELCFRILRTGAQGQETLARWVAADLGAPEPGRRSASAAS